MDNYEKFQDAVKAQRKQSYMELKTELKNIKCRLEKFLSEAMESTSSIAERDFKVHSL